MINTIKTVLAFLLLIAMGAILATIIAPGLLHDIQLRGAVESAENARVVAAWCHPMHPGVLSSCEVRVAVQGQPKEQKFEYWLPPGFIGRQDVSVLRRIGSPEVLTTSLGQNYLVSRIVIFALLLAGIAGLVIGGIVIRVREARGQQVQVPAERISVQPVQSRNRQTVGGSAENSRSQFGRR